jgi:3-carboxy-cis,cis-muconate cycloisomerase
VAVAAVRAISQGVSLPDALLADRAAATVLRDAGISRADLDAALDPAGYLGSAAEFIRRALAAHARLDGAI